MFKSRIFKEFRSLLDGLLRDAEVAFKAAESKIQAELESKTNELFEMAESDKRRAAKDAIKNALQEFLK